MARRPYPPSSHSGTAWFLRILPARLEDFIRECGLPTKMSQLKSTVEITPEVLRQVADTCNIIKCNPRELDREEIYQILMECL